MKHCYTWEVIGLVIDFYPFGFAWRPRLVRIDFEDGHQWSFSFGPFDVIKLVNWGSK